MSLFHQSPAVHVNHAQLRVSNLARMKQFYSETLGFQVKDTGADTAEISADGKNPLITLDASASFEPAEEPRTGLFHIAFLLPDRASAGSLLKHLVEINYPIQGASDHGVSEAVYLADPEGNGLELYRDRASEEWDWDGSQVRLVTEPLDAEGMLQEASVWQGMPQETVLGHIHLKITDIEKAKNFYIKGLQFSPVSALGDHALFISSADYHHHIGLNTWSGRQLQPLEKNERGLAFFEIMYPDNESRNRVVESLTALGFQLETNDGSIAVLDPFGIRIKLVTA